jgi:hypothetical protein
MEIVPKRADRIVERYCHVGDCFLRIMQQGQQRFDNANRRLGIDP